MSLLYSMTQNGFVRCFPASVCRWVARGFKGLALDQRLKDDDSETWSGMQIIDLEKRSCVDGFWIDGAIAESYNLELIPNFRCPMAISPGSPEAAKLVIFNKEVGKTGEFDERKCFQPVLKKQGIAYSS